jgi:hypothetical protein
MRPVRAVMMSKQGTQRAMRVDDAVRLLAARVVLRANAKQQTGTTKHQTNTQDRALNLA